MSQPIISPDGRVGAFWSLMFVPGGPGGQKQEFALFDTATGKVLRRIPHASGPDFMPAAMLFSPDSNMLAVLADAKKIELYEISSGKLLRTLDTGPAAPQVPGQPGFPGMYAPFQKLLYSPDGKALAFQAGPGATIIVRATATGNEIATLTLDKGSQAMLRAFTPDRRCLALETSDGTATLYELASGQPRGTYGTKRPPPINNDPMGGLLGFPGGILGGFPGPIDQSKVSVAIAPDLKLLALSGADGSVHLWDVVAGKELAALKGHTATVNACAFAPNGKTLASASADTTALVWDVTRVKRPALPVKALTAGDLEKRWQALAESDGARSWVAMGDLIAAPRDALAFLKDRVKLAAPLDMKRVEQLLAELDSKQFKVRVTAASELFKLGNQLVPVIDKALAAKPSLEAKQRLEELRSKLTGTRLQGERLRAFRAVEVLERIGTPEARQVLQALADGAPGALLTTSAQSALKR